MGGGGICFVGMAGSVEKRLEYHVVDQARDGGAVAIGSVFFSLLGIITQM